MGGCPQGDLRDSTRCARTVRIITNECQLRDAPLVISHGPRIRGWLLRGWCGAARRGAAASLALGGRAYQVNVMVENSTSAQHVAQALAVGCFVSSRALKPEERRLGQCSGMTPEHEQYSR